jgi:hypothetical protein
MYLSSPSAATAKSTHGESGCVIPHSFILS